MELEQIFFTRKEEARDYLLELYEPIAKCIKLSDKYYSLESGIEKLINGIASYSGGTGKMLFYLYNIKIWKKAFWRRYFSFLKFVKGSLEEKLAKEIVKVTNEEVMHYAISEAGLYKKHHEVLAILSKIFPELFPNRRFQKKKIKSLLKE